jgi:hypothetical protein
LISVNELQHPEQITGDRLFSDKDDFINLLEVARDYPHIHEIEINSETALQGYLNRIHMQDKMIPLFIKEAATGEFRIVVSDMSKMTASIGDKLVYLGKELNLQADYKS